MKILFYVFFACSHVHALSAEERSKDNSTTDVGWVPASPGRDTLSIITSCVATISICICVWKTNAKWMVFGLLAPELVVFSAWRQYVSARALQQKLTALENPDGEKAGVRPKFKSCPSGSSQTPSKLDGANDSGHTWSLRHGYHITMGGFVIDINFPIPATSRQAHSRSQRLTVTPRGALLLAECGFLPRMSEKEIKDRSKADGLAKLVVCLQAAWMMVQIIARVCEDLPVTLLEVNTLSHVVCAFVIYMLWWSKPKAINDPVLLKGEWTQSMGAYMWMSSIVSGRRKSDGLKKALVFWTTTAYPELQHITLDSESSQTSRHQAPFKDTRVVQQITECSAIQDSNIHAVTCLGSRSRLRFTHFPDPRFSKHRLDEDADTHERWRLALEAIDNFAPVRSRVESRHRHKGTRLRTEELVAESAENWPTDGLLRGVQGVLMGMILWFVSIGYGAIHAAAWHGHFPSTTEKWLWRASSVDLMGSGLVWLMINFLGHMSARFNKYWDSVIDRRVRWPTIVVLGTLCFLCGLAYVWARLFLVVEAAVSLRQLPLAVYQTPEWTNSIPHL